MSGFGQEENKMRYPSGAMLGSHCAPLASQVEVLFGNSMVADVISHFKVKSPWNEVQLVLKVHTAEERNQRNLNKQETSVSRIQ